MTDLHFLRPEWLWLLLLVPLAPWLWRRLSAGGHGWDSVIPGRFLSPLLRGQTPSGQRRQHRGLIPAVMLLIASISLAGPAWRQTPHPLQERTDSLVVVLDLSLSMLASDLSPDRLTRAKQKIRDLLAIREGALTGLVVYAAGAHVVTPLTDDRRTIEALLPSVDPFIMPANGSRPDRGVAKAIELLDRGGRGPGQILLMADSLDAPEIETIEDQVAGTGYRLHALAVGTASGGPIPLPERGFIQDQGEIVIAKTPLGPFQRLAQATGGEASRISVGDTDLGRLGLTDLTQSDWQESERERELELWHDDGYWLAWLILPLALWGWRRGALPAVLFTVLVSQPQTAQALEWEDLWQTPDQQGAELFPEQPEEAAETFEDPAWRGSALYRAGDYEAAAKAFARLDTADGHYNRGNALAKAGDYQKAIEAYEKALEINPDMEDAIANKALLEDLLEQQQQQQQSGGQENQSQQGQDGNKQQNGQGQKGQQGPSQGQQGQQGQSQDPQQGQQGETGEHDGPQEGEPEEQRDGEPRQAQAQQAEDGQEQADAAGMTEGPTEAEQSREQWLRRVPDDPGGLLRRKFLHQYRQQAPQDSEENEPW